NFVVVLTVRDAFGQVPFRDGMRGRLIIAFVILVGTAATFLGFASVTLLKQYLVSTIDPHEEIRKVEGGLAGAGHLLEEHPF
ncbi:hypothetical protein R6G99_11625, partial [Actinotignum timonense]|nr:hypothetical protein [Actinotignum timonense]